jgi:hypothetical protein
MKSSKMSKGGGTKVNFVSRVSRMGDDRIIRVPNEYLDKVKI